MDAVVGLLDGVRARGAFVLRMVLDPPWSMRIQDDAPLTADLPDHGRGGHRRPTAAERLAERRRRRADPRHRALRLRRRPGDHAARSSSTRATAARRCGGDDLRFEMSLGVRTWGNSATGRDAVGRSAPTRATARSARDCSTHCRPCWCCAATRMGHPAGGSARRRGRPRRPGPGGLPRPPARPAADRGAPHVVRPRRERPAVVARRTRSGRRAGAAADLQQSRSSRGPSRILLRPLAVRVPCSPADSASRSASRRSRF